MTNKQVSRLKWVARESITLPRYHGREEMITWSMPWEGDDQIVEFWLFIDNEPQPDRQLRLWLNVIY